MIPTSLGPPTTGIGMQFVGDALYAIEIHVSPNGSTGWESVAVVPPLSLKYLDNQPYDGVARYYRARSVEVVNNVIARIGPWSDSIPTNGKPIVF